MPKATPPRQEPLRRRISIPQVDTSTQRWWEAQDDPSVSIRLLIREEIEKNGYVDKLNHPVEQQPRRGRPPAGAERQDVETDDDDVQPAQSGPEPEQPSRTAASSASAGTRTNRASAAMDAAPADDADGAASADDTDSTDSASALDDLMNN